MYKIRLLIKKGYVGPPTPLGPELSGVFRGPWLEPTSTGGSGSRAGTGPPGPVEEV